jgi:hypothetical protein
MIIEISRKKILITTIALFCLFLLIVFGLGLKQKTQKMEKEIQIQKCIKTAGEINFPEMIDLTDKLSTDLAFREKIKIYAYPFTLLLRHLGCEFLQEQNEKEKKALVDYAMEAYQRTIFLNLNKAWEKVKVRKMEIFIQPEESFLYNLSSGNMTEICPDELPINCRKDNGVSFLEPNEWCGRICETLAQYEKDKDKLNEEVTNFKEWNEGVKDSPGSPFNWRLAVAYRFGGKDSALKICDNVAEAQKRNSCLSAAISFEIRGLACEAAFEQLSQLICDYQYKNY